MALTHRYAQLGHHFFHCTQVQPLKEQRLVEINAAWAEMLGVDFKQTDIRDLLSGQTSLTSSLSMVYAGHQFGGFSPQLGDGRGILLGEWQDRQGINHDLHLKGAGPTPYSRRGDGRAVLRSCIREYLACEAMSALGIPSSRALCLFDSNELVYREGPERAAMLLRTAKTHIRFGHFEYFFAQQRHSELQQLIDYCLDEYFQDSVLTDNPLVSMLTEIVERTAKMIALWQSIGFAHGVMNTDNMSILGETIDFGPYGFMEAYDPNWICNHSDYEGRYAFDRQPAVGLWNLNVLMRCFSQLLPKETLVAILSHYEPTLLSEYSQLMMAKLGLADGQTDSDAIKTKVEKLIGRLLSLMAKEKIDYSYFFRLLSTVDHPRENASLVDECIDRQAFQDWWREYAEVRLSLNSDWQKTTLEMRQINPKYILRNYLAQQAIEAAEQGNYLPFRQLLKVLQQPYAEHNESASLAKRPPEWAKSISVSCSS